MNDSLSTTGNWLKTAHAILIKAGIATARLDCLVLLEDATGKDRSYLLAHPETEIMSPSLVQLHSQIKRRTNHEPLAYIRGKSEFYGREFIVNKHTLEPRPETETMIDLLKQILEKYLLADARVVPLGILDVGTGSGCLGITVKLEAPGARVIATDVSVECLAVARNNAEILGADVSFYHGDLLQPEDNASFYLPPTFALLANLPYVPDSHMVNEAAMHEPKLAIFGGEDGLDLYRKLFAQLEKLEHKPQFVLTESLPFQHAELEKIARKRGYKRSETDDFIQLFTK